MAIFAIFRIFFWKSRVFLILCAKNVNFIMIKSRILHAITISTSCGVVYKIWDWYEYSHAFESRAELFLFFNPFPSHPHVKTVSTLFMSKLVNRSYRYHFRRKNFFYKNFIRKWVLNFITFYIFILVKILK